MSNETHETAFVPAKQLDTPYPLIDSDPHFKRVVGYARSSDYAVWAGMTGLTPFGMWLMERIHPSGVGKGGFAPIQRLATAMGFGSGFIMLCTLSSLRFYGMRENKREQEMDMREMVDKVKKGQPLYGVSSLTPYMQGVASRNSRYSAVFHHMLPWMNFVNHNQHGVDTAKYYQQAERELEAEGQGKKK